MTGAECASNGGGGIEGSPISTDSEGEKVNLHCKMGRDGPK